MNFRSIGTPFWVFIPTLASFKSCFRSCSSFFNCYRYVRIFSSLRDKIFILSLILKIRGVIRVIHQVKRSFNVLLNCSHLDCSCFYRFLTRGGYLPYSSLYYLRFPRFSADFFLKIILVPVLLV